MLLHCGPPGPCSPSYCMGGRVSCMDDSARTTGERIARARRRAGLTQRDLAQRCQRSLSWVQKVETGARGVDRMSVLVMLADVLRIELVELTGQPYRHATAALDSGHGAVPVLRQALQRATLPSSALDREPRPLPEVERDLTEVEALRQAAALTRSGSGSLKLWRIWPATAVSETTKRGWQRSGSWSGPRTWPGLRRLCSVSMTLPPLRSCGKRPRLPSWTIRWSRRLLTGMSLGCICTPGTWTRPAGMRLIRIGRLAPHLDTRHGTLLMGALNLRTAIAAARSWDRATAEEYLGRAREIARGFDDDADLRQTAFGPRNVELHATESALELGDPRLAVERAEQIAPLLPGLPSRERQAQGWTISALSYGLARQDRAALRALEQSASIAREHVSNAPMARALVADLMERERRGSGSG